MEEGGSDIRRIYVGGLESLSAVLRQWGVLCVPGENNRRETKGGHWLRWKSLRLSCFFGVGFNFFNVFWCFGMIHAKGMASCNQIYY